MRSLREGFLALRPIRGCIVLINISLTYYEYFHATKGGLCLLNLYTFALLRIVPKRTISSTIQDKFLSVIEHTNDQLRLVRMSVAESLALFPQVSDGSLPFVEIFKLWAPGIKT